MLVQYINTIYSLYNFKQSLSDYLIYDCNLFCEDFKNYIKEVNMEEENMEEENMESRQNYFNDLNEALIKLGMLIDPFSEK